jgi:hypothetical protein
MAKEAVRESVNLLKRRLRTVSGCANVIKSERGLVIGLNI